MKFEESAKEGQIGENIYIEFLKENNINFYDARENPIYQHIDIDFVILKNNHSHEEVLQHLTHAEPQTRHIRQQEIGYAVEVKLDKVTHNPIIKNNQLISNGTGNIVYELISHAMPGCMAKSCADFILYVCVGQNINTQFTELKKAYLINLYNWRQYLCRPINIKTCVLKALETLGHNDNDILNILQPIKDIANNKSIVTDYTQKLIKFFPNNLKIT
jgi:hypothetical protein